MQSVALYVLEYGQKHNRLHIHLVLTGGITRADLEKLWGLGDVNADALRFEKDGLAALAKYLAKGGGEGNTFINSTKMRK